MTFTKKLAYRILEIEKPKQLEEVLAVLLTDSEIEEIEKRGKILKRLIQGKTQREISDELGVGIATVTRGSAQLKLMKNHKWWANWLWR